MSAGFGAVRPFFRTQMTGLGFKEWKDGFNFENIPSTLLDKSYHIENPSGDRVGSYDQRSQNFEQVVLIRVFFKGYRYPADAIDNAQAQLDNIVDQVLDPRIRIGVKIKNVYLNSWQTLQLAKSNDNGAILEMEFRVLLIAGLGA